MPARLSADAVSGKLAKCFNLVALNAHENDQHHRAEK
jgi:hypothetical protein